MLCCRIDNGALFYGEPRRREKVDFSAELRESLEASILDMHKLFSRKHTPKVKTGKHCSNCSLKDLCLPGLLRKPEDAVRKYLEENIE